MSIVASETVPIPLQPSPATPPTSPRTWMRRISGGGQTIETCPTWCDDGHRGDLDGALDDLQHGTYTDGVPLPVFDPHLGAVAMPVLAARLSVDPYSERPERRLPHVVLEPWQDEVMECLDPEQLAAVIAQVRAQCDRLDGVLARLVGARAEYR